MALNTEKTAAAATPTRQAAPKAGDMRAIVAASAAGSTIEWHDFLIYSTAASLVFGKLFVPTQHPLAGTLLAIGTIGVGFFEKRLLARPRFKR